MAINFPTGLGNITYEYDYFSGSQTLVYFEEVLVDDIVRIAWSINQQRQPIYGYASQYFNALADGIVIGGGSFWIAYKEAAYIPTILKYIAERRNPDDPIFASPALTPRSGSAHHTGLAQSSAEFQGTTDEGGVRQSGLVQRANIEQLMALEGSEAEDAELQRILQGYSINISAMNDREFEDFAEVFEDAVWYGGNSPRSGRSDAMSGNFSGGEIPEGHALALRRADQFPPFDIIVTFGDINGPASNHTVQRLTDCVITDTQFGPIEPSGEPLYVQHNFIARNMM